MDNLTKELHMKERSIDDLYRFITTRSDSNPNFSLLLGSGCSVTSDIRSGGQLIDDWRREIYQSYHGAGKEDYNKDEATKYLKENYGSWYNENNEYSSLFEKKYDLPRQRRMFVEQEVSEKTPSIGYAYLVNLVKKFYFNTIFTTNFDDLLNEAFYQFSETRPIVCAHDSSINSITLTSKRPKIIKLHGDYLFDDIKSTLRETESLEENIRNKFIEFSKEYGLIVVGYGGHDRSIMDVFSYLLKQEDYFKHGIYWCIRKDDKISDELKKLLWKDRVYFVRIDGFDELFAQLHYTSFKDKLPIDTSFISNKSQDIIQKFLLNKKLENTKSEIIKNDLERLKQQNEKNSIYEEIKALQPDNKFGQDELENNEFKILLEIQNLYRQQSYDEIIKIIETNLANSNNETFKIELYKKQISVYQRENKISNVKDTFDKLISIDPRNPIHLIKKMQFENNYNQKLDLIDKAISIDPYYEKFYNEKILLLLKNFDEIKKDESRYKEILELINKSLEVNPSIDNDAWAIKFNFLYNLNRNDISLVGIINNLEKQNPYSVELLSLKYKLLIKKEEQEEFIKTISSAEEHFYPKDKINYKLLLLEIFDDLNKKEEINSLIQNMDNNPLYSSNNLFLNKKAGLFVKKFNRLDEAIEILSNTKKNSKTLKNLLVFLVYNGQNEKAKEEFDSLKYLFSEKERKDFLKDYYDSVEDYSRALKVIEEMYEDRYINEPMYVIFKSYYFLQQKKYQDAKDFLKNYLEVRNFNLSLYAEIINYEFACKNINSKYNKERISKLKNSTDKHTVKAAIASLEENKSELYSLLEVCCNEDYTDMYEMRKWPIFNWIRNDSRYKNIMKIKD